MSSHNQDLASQLMKIRDIAKMLGVSDYRARILIASFNIQPVAGGRSPLYSRADFVRALSSGAGRNAPYAPEYGSPKTTAPVAPQQTQNGHQRAVRTRGVGPTAGKWGRTPDVHYLSVNVGSVTEEETQRLSEAAMVLGISRTAFVRKAVFDLVARTLEEQAHLAARAENSAPKTETPEAGIDSDF